MKTKQEQTKQMLKTLCDKFQCSAIDRSYMAKSCRQCEDIIEALHEAGYGDVSGYKVEREMLGSQIKALKQRLNNKYVEIERLKAENERFENNMKNVLKIEKRQAQIDVLKELKTRHDYAIKNMGYPWDISQQIDELIEEVENDNDEKVKRIFNEAGLTVEKREQPLIDEELDKQVKEIMSCFGEVQNGEDKS